MEKKDVEKAEEILPPETPVEEEVESLEDIEIDGEETPRGSTDIEKDKRAGKKTLVDDSDLSGKRILAKTGGELVLFYPVAGLLLILTALYFLVRLYEKRKLRK